MAYNFGYKAEGTILDGFLGWIQNNHYSWYKENVKVIVDLNPHLINIRKGAEPLKPVAKTVEKNAIYISKHLGFKTVKEYFKQLNK